jgi:mannose-6-phosphate isomerase
MCVEGSAEIKIFSATETICLGETVLIPAIAQKVTLFSENCKLLEVTI